ncbi:MAG: tRNA pseudouridine(13) synthase TruD, partial [Firmicutes bacterium]|nr:tRNA pseudouridine(13) synthase TruD [Bacillota bacterium]
MKSVPDDFIVREEAQIELSGSGPYGLYLLEKADWTTVDVLRHIASRAGVPYARFSYGGKKDRRARTYQHVTVQSKRDLSTEGERYRFTLLGRVSRRMGPDLIAGNRFAVTLRALEDGEGERMRRNASQVRSWGFVNYFDDQRFGSLDPGRGFFAERILKGHWRGALELYLGAARRPRPPHELR